MNNGAKNGVRNGHTTIKDIANIVGVSTATVSLVLSKNSRISDETSRKVFEAVNNNSYRPSAAARSLVLNKTGNISLIVPQLSRVFLQPFFALSINGVYDACIEKGYRVQIDVAGEEFVRTRKYLRLFQERVVDGMLYIGSTFSDTYLNELPDEGYPFIFSGSYLKESKLSFVTGDNVSGGRMAVKHLLSVGRKKIAHIAGDFKVASAFDRFKGYKEALEEGGIKFNPALAVSCDFTEEGAFIAAQKVLAHNPDAVFAGNDIMAAGVMKALKTSGRKVPEDVSVCGMDDIPPAALMEPALTTVRYRIYEMAHLAAKKLVDMIEGKITKKVGEVLPVELVIRESCGGKKWGRGKL